MKPGEAKSAVLGVAEIAAEMSVTDATVRVWINSGKLPAYRLPGSGSQKIIRVRRDDFERFLKVCKGSITACA